MPRITISYRRDDSGVITGRIFDRLTAHYGRNSVFRDIDNIPLGVDFRQHVGDALGKSDVVLAIVGPRWTGARETGSRLADEADPVRLEIEATLRNGVPLIPVLVLGAAMPQSADLPDSLKDFAYRNGIRIDAGQDFDTHMARLIHAMDRMLRMPRGADDDAPTNPAAGEPRRGFRFSIALRIAIAVAILAIVSVPSVDWYFGGFRPGSQRPAPAPPPPAAALPMAPTPKPPSVDAEVVFWQSIASSSNADDFREYLSKYPDGRFAGLARNRLTALTPPPPPPPPPSEPEPRQVTANAVICGRQVGFTMTENAAAALYAPYLGAWAGVWNNASRICGAVIIKQVSPDGVGDAFYIYGPSSAGSSFPWRQQSVTAHFENANRFSFQDEQGSRFTFEWNNDALDATFSGQSGSLQSQFTKLN